MVLAATLLATISCKTLKPGTSSNIKQGIEGYIYELTGNQMPMKGKPAGSNKHGVKRVVYFYQATTLQQVQGNTPLFDKVNTPLVLKIMSNADGRYKVSLPAGKYSIFVKENDKLFAAETDGTGILNPVTVTTDKITRRDITITVNAAF